MELMAKVTGRRHGVEGIDRKARIFETRTTKSTQLFESVSFG